MTLNQGNAQKLVDFVAEHICYIGVEVFNICLWTQIYIFPVYVMSECMFHICLKLVYMVIHYSVSVTSFVKMDFFMLLL